MIVSPGCGCFQIKVLTFGLFYLGITTVFLVPAGSSEAQKGSSFLSKIDHLVYATPDLAIGVEQVERLLGVRAAPGGQHPGRGTRNALIALGEATYLEIIGPDPEQPEPDRPRPFGIDELKASRLVTWVAKGRDLERIVEDAKHQGIDLGGVQAGSRRRPDGVVLSWRLTDVSKPRAGGIVPFFIDWGKTPHPARTSTQGCVLVDLRAEHPDAERVQRMLTGVGLELPVDAGPAPALIATISTPRGRVELR
jgi:hypothetical protein